MEHEDRRTTLDRLTEHSHARAAADIGSAGRTRPTTLERLEAATNAVGEAASTAKEGWENLSISGGAVLATAVGAAPVVLGGVVAYGLTKAAIAHLLECSGHAKQQDAGIPEGTGSDLPKVPEGPTQPVLPAAPVRKPFLPGKG